LQNKLLVGLGYAQMEFAKTTKQQWNVVTVQLGAHLLYDRPQNENWSFQRHPAQVGERGGNNVLLDMATA
jgi:hypothetical protein